MTYIYLIFSQKSPGQEKMDINNQLHSLQHCVMKMQFAYFFPLSGLINICSSEIKLPLFEAAGWSYTCQRCRSLHKTRYCKAVTLNKAPTSFERCQCRRQPSQAILMPAFVILLLYEPFARHSTRLSAVSLSIVRRKAGHHILIKQTFY